MSVLFISARSMEEEVIKLRAHNRTLLEHVRSCNAVIQGLGEVTPVIIFIIIIVFQIELHITVAHT